MFGIKFFTEKSVFVDIESKVKPLDYGMVAMSSSWVMNLTRWLVISSVLTATRAAFSPEVVEMIQSWAPLVWLHSGEQFMPSSVEFFLEHVTLQNRKGRVLDQQPTLNKLPGGPSSTVLHLQSRQKLTCPSCLGPTFFHGNNVNNGGVPVYAIVREYQDAWKTIDVVYHTFYPYNRGKQVCIGISTGKEKEKCLGNVESFGHHVGDWEHVTLRFQNGKPHIIYLSVHNFGAYYVWNESAGFFQLHKGESPKEKAARRGRRRKFARDLQVTFPTVLHVSGKHPVLYSANGSHGIWAGPGKHTYSTFPLLEDFTDQGVAWNTWENLVVIPWNDTPYPYAGPLEWLNFRGGWGNAKNGCDLERLSGECRLNHGPIFPGGPDDMPPPRIQRSRQAAPTVAPILPLPPPHYLAYTPTIPQYSQHPVPAGRTSSLLNYRYKRRDPATGSTPTKANMKEEPNGESGTDAKAKLTNRLVTFVPEDSSTMSP
ncbi:hypothetical protein OUZ56_021158 [Daphnia magna]|uniref:Vacuolar protein sorting-associated protein 62 n=1 Tax=Daphnia magna TaxID=35525 RepID=A0ABQ9ZGK0_9CRUS|nr:hypothetical protein OUZ56_021158 [Daphnia magna]